MCSITWDRWSEINGRATRTLSLAGSAPFLKRVRHPPFHHERFGFFGIWIPFVLFRLGILAWCWLCYQWTFFIIFFDCAETSADLANIDSLTSGKRLPRPFATRAEDHAIFFRVNPFTCGRPFRCDPPFKAQRLPSPTCSSDGPPSSQRVWPFKSLFRSSFLFGRPLK